MAEQKVIETRLGRRVVDPDKVILFPQGLMGLEERHEFTLLQISEGSPFLVLQSMDEASLGLVVADPFSFLSDYAFTVGDAEQAILLAEESDDLAVLVTVSIPPGKPEDTALNLTGPILINHKARIGLQVLQPDADPDRFFLNQAGEK
jgi:flagellar assembly factor FliW